MSFKSFDLASDIAVLQTSINETVSITGSIITTGASNAKRYANISTGSVDLGGYFQTIYDASPTSSLSTPLFDVTFGYSTGSTYNVGVTTTSSQTEKVKIYREMASLLLGNADSVFNINSTDRREAIFILFKRGIAKDEIKKGSVNIVINSAAPTQYTASDAGANATFKQSLGGDYAPLKYNGTGSEVGQVWYNAGIVVLHPDSAWGAIPVWSASMAKTLINLQSSGSINQIVDGFRTHVEQISIHNQTNLQSTVYFCRAYNSEFNYSSNPTFVDSDKKIRVTSGSNVTQTRTYVTTVGFYDENDNLMAVAKVNKPVLKSPETEAIFKVRLDY